MRKFCPNCEEMLKVNDRNPAMGHCNGCGWSGHLGLAATEPKLPAVAPKMPYVSIDIETTGLDPATCQILEIGAVWDDWTQPLQNLPTYRRLVVHDRLMQHHERQVLQVAAFEERRIEVHPAILINSHCSQPWTFHGNERHHLMRHVGHFAGGQYPHFG